MLSLFANSYCSMPCNGRGVCDTSKFFFPACICLTGFAGKQCTECPPGFTGDRCEECPSGYYGSNGSTCDLCPEGGNETLAAPRISDTCGVAGSGRSRGTCHDGAAGSGKCTCFAGFSGESCTEGVCPAGTVEKAKKKGVFYEAFCEPCPEGTYQGLVGGDDGAALLQLRRVRERGRDRPVDDVACPSGGPQHLV